MIRAHRIKKNETTTAPRRWVYLDTEANERQTLDARVQTFRLAVTAFDRSDTPNFRPCATQWRTHHSPAQLWAYVANVTRRRSRTVVVAHNLAYDLRISEAFRYLPAQGFAMVRLSVHQRAVSATFRRGDRSLLLVDSMSWLPLGLERVGALVALDKVPLPPFTDSDDAWERRCRRDVEILRAAYGGLVEWVRANDLGNWQKTGAGMAWANWRHRHYSHTVLVHDDERAQAAETASVYTGRCEAWRHGKLPKGQWTEWDLPLAYPRVALTAQLPVNLQGTIGGSDWGRYERAMTTRRLLIKADVVTEAPTLPHRTEAGIAWPVGALTGWWWDVELAAALENGAQVTPRGAYVYTARPALAEWAEWVIGALEGPGGNLTALQAVAVKNWARALIGRFATRYTTWEPWGRAPEAGVGVHPIADLRTGDVGRVLTLGDDAWVGWNENYGADACVGVMAAIMAEARVRLWTLMRAAGLENVAYVDTDSLITNAAGSKALQALIDQGGGWGLRPKTHHRTLVVLGPRQLIVADHPRVAGIPRNAWLHDSGKWVGETWEGLETALARGRHDQVVIKPGVWNVRGHDNRRGHSADGSTFALVAPILDGG